MVATSLAGSAVLHGMMLSPDWVGRCVQARPDTFVHSTTVLAWAPQCPGARLGQTTTVLIQARIQWPLVAVSMALPQKMRPAWQQKPGPGGLLHPAPPRQTVGVPGCLA
jgi:hypothetical protein